MAGDAQFHAWQNNFVTYVNGHPADSVLAAGDVVDLNNSAATWTADYPAHTAVQTAPQAARQAKDGARDDLEGAIRPLVRRLQASPDVDDGERVVMAVREAVSRAGIVKHAGCHTFRHSFAPHLLETGYDISNDTGTSWAQRRQHDHDLHPCSEQRWPRSPRSGRWAVSRLIQSA